MSVRAIVLALVMAAAPAVAAQQAERGYRVGGVVLDATTGTPVPRAQLFLMNGQEQTEVTAADDGRFEFRGVPPGKYPLYATAPGYIHQGLDEHGGYTTGIAVREGQDTTHIVFRLRRQGVITGRVTDEHGEAVRQAAVMLIRAGAAAGSRGATMQDTQQTNDLGVYRFAHLEPGRYFVGVQAQPWYQEIGLSEGLEPSRTEDGSPATGGQGRAKPDPLLDVVYAITFYPGSTSAAAAGQLSLAAGDKQEGDIQLAAVPGVHVRLTNLPEGDPGNTNVGAMAAPFGSVELPFPVPSERISPGEYELAGLPPGEVTLIVEYSGDQGASMRRIRANVSAGDTVDGGETRVTANISGRVLLGEGQTVPDGAEVSLLGDEKREESASLQKDGSFSLVALPAGTYLAGVNLPGLDARVAAVAATGAKVAGRSVTIGDTGDVQLSITIRQGEGQVTGVAKLDGRPASGVMVLLVPESGENLEEDSRLDQSDSDGSFTLPAVLAGKYVLLAIADGWDLDRTDWDVLKPYLENGQALQIVANDRTEVTVKVQHKLR